MQLFLMFIIILSTTIIRGLVCSNHCVNINVGVHAVHLCMCVCLSISTYISMNLLSLQQPLWGDSSIIIS